MKESYNISMLFKMFKKFEKVVQGWKNWEKWAKIAVPESPIIYYSRLFIPSCTRSIRGYICTCTTITFSQTSPVFFFFTCLQYQSFENNVGKGEIARYEQFLLYPTMFSTHFENCLPFSSNLKL